MRILVNGYIGPRITGIGRTLIETLKKMAIMSSDSIFIVYANFDNRELIEAFEMPNIVIKTVNISRENTLLNLLFNVLIFPFLALYEKVDKVYISNFMLMLLKFRPTVVVIHDMIEFKIDAKFSKFKMLYRNWAVPSMAKKSDHVITVSENSKKDIVEICGIKKSKISVIYNGIASNFNVCTTQRRMIDEEYILFVGTVDFPGKNIHNTIRAFELLVSKYKKKFKLVICGMPGKGAEVIYSQIKNSKYRHLIQYLGYVEDQQLKCLYQFASIFVFISYYEGFGLPIIEAMKFGVPVITSDRSCLPEIAGSAALICDPDNFAEICEAFNSLIVNTTKRQKMINKGFDNIKRFNWSNVGRESLKILKCNL